MKTSFNPLGENQWKEGLFLGSGGAAPGVDRYDLPSGQVEKILTLPTGSSVYTLSLSSHSPSLAVGSRSGRLYWLVPASNETGDSPFEMRSLLQGSPLLAVQLAGSNLVTSDTAGRCLLWRWDNPWEPQPLPVGSDLICGLEEIDEDHVAGLSTGGELWIWKLSTREVLDRQSVPPPASLAAMVPLLDWPSVGAWVWPGRNGSLVVYDRQRSTARVCPCHQGEFFTLIPWGNEIWTLGMSDGQFRRWDRHLTLIQSWTVPCGILTAVIWEDTAIRFLAVQSSGLVSRYFLDGSVVRGEGHLAGGPYRSIQGPVYEALHDGFRQRQAGEAKAIAQNLREKMETGEPEEIESLHQRLIQLGYSHLSLGLRAEAARANQDLMGELRCVRSLWELLESRRQILAEPHIRYTELLEIVWQNEEALQVCQRLHAVQPNKILADRMSRITRLHETLTTYPCVIEPTVSVADLIEAAEIVGHPIMGRYWVNTLEALPCSTVEIQPNELVERYDRNRQRPAFSDLPAARILEVRWLTADSVREMTLVVFTDEAAPVPELELAIKCLSTGSETRIVPLILFHAPVIEAIKSSSANSIAHLKQAWRKVEDREYSHPWLQRVYQGVMMTLKQLVTQAVAKKTR